MTDTEGLAEPDGTLKGPGVAIYGAWALGQLVIIKLIFHKAKYCICSVWCHFFIPYVVESSNEIGHHEYLNHHGQPEARLIRTHSLATKRRDLEDSPFVAGAAVAMLWLPLMMLRRLKMVYIDGLVNVVDIRSFTDDLSAQAKAQTTVVSFLSRTQMRTCLPRLCLLLQASVIMAVNASILAVPGLGAQLATKTMCSISFVLSFYCIIGCAMAQHFGHRLRSLDFAVRTILFVVTHAWRHQLHSCIIYRERWPDLQSLQVYQVFCIWRGNQNLDGYVLLLTGPLQFGVFHPRISRRYIYRWIWSILICEDWMHAGAHCWSRSCNSVDDGQFRSWTDSLMMRRNDSCTIGATY